LAGGTDDDENAKDEALLSPIPSPNPKPRSNPTDDALATIEDLKLFPLIISSCSLVITELNKIIASAN